MFLSRLVYFSRPTSIGDADIDRILGSCYANNHINNVTGALFYDGGWFIQVLEGARSTLSKLFVTIAMDDRHTDVNLMEFAFVRQRMFSDWTMRYIGGGAEQERIVRKYMPGCFDPNMFTESALAVQLLRELADAAEREVELA